LTSRDSDSHSISALQGNCSNCDSSKNYNLLTGFQEVTIFGVIAQKKTSIKNWGDFWTVAI
jgi:hypothetical protein